MAPTVIVGVGNGDVWISTVWDDSWKEYIEDDPADCVECTIDDTCSEIALDHDIIEDALSDDRQVTVNYLALGETRILKRIYPTP